MVYNKTYMRTRTPWASNEDEVAWWTNVAPAILSKVDQIFDMVVPEHVLVGLVNKKGLVLMSVDYPQETVQEAPEEATPPPRRPPESSITTPPGKNPLSSEDWGVAIYQFSTDLTVAARLLGYLTRMRMMCAADVAKVTLAQLKAKGGMGEKSVATIQRALAKFNMVLRE